MADCCGHNDATRLLLVKLRFQVNRVLPGGNATALCLASKYSISEVIKTLLDARASLSAAAARGRSAVVKICSTPGLKEARTKEGHTSLVAAAEEIHSKFVKILLASGF
jgi:hypothetical protein